MAVNRIRPMVHGPGCLPEKAWTRSGACRVLLLPFSDRGAFGDVDLIGAFVLPYPLAYYRVTEKAAVIPVFTSGAHLLEYLIQVMYPCARVVCLCAFKSK